MPSEHDRANARKESDQGRSPISLGRALVTIADVARFLRLKRIEAGALTLASPEVRFMLDSETHEPLRVQAYEHKETNRTVEEFMLWANISVASRTTEVFPRCAVLRRHPPPQPGAFDSLEAAAKSAGFELDTSSSKGLATSLDRAQSKHNPWLNKVLRILATRCMQQAVYFPSGECAPAQYLHYGLATPIYTHFTSPIRRYADVMVHRLLAASLEVDVLPHEYEDRQWMKRVTRNLNTRHYNSQMAGRASAALFTQVFFADKPREEDALVLKLKRNGAMVLVPAYGIEGPVLLVPSSRTQSKATSIGWAVSNESQITLSQDGMQLECNLDDGEQLRLKVFDKVRVGLSVEERDRARARHELVYRILDPPFHKRTGALATLPSKRGRMEISGGDPTQAEPKETSTPAEMTKKRRTKKKSPAKRK